MNCPHPTIAFYHITKRETLCALCAINLDHDTDALISIEEYGKIQDGFFGRDVAKKIIKHLMKTQNDKIASNAIFALEN